MLKFELKGFKEVERRLDDLRRRAEALDGTHSIPLAELFPVDFLTKYTQFASLEDMFQASGFAVESQKDFEKIPDDEWDNFIKSRTRFSSWKEMLETAFEEWTDHKLGF